MQRRCTHFVILLWRVCAACSLDGDLFFVSLAITWFRRLYYGSVRDETHGTSLADGGVRDRWRCDAIVVTTRSIM